MNQKVVWKRIESEKTIYTIEIAMNWKYKLIAILFFAGSNRNRNIIRIKYIQSTIIIYIDILQNHYGHNLLTHLKYLVSFHHLPQFLYPYNKSFHQTQGMLQLEQFQLVVRYVLKVLNRNKREPVYLE